MTYPYAQAPAPRSRPTVVTISSYLLYLVGALTVIGAVLSLSVINTMYDVYRDAYAGDTAAGTENFVVGATVVGVVITVLFAAGLIVLAIFNNRGRQGARITTWVIGGILVCCRGAGIFGTAATSSMNLDTGNGPSASQVEQRLMDELPSWYTPVTVALSVISLLAILAAIILLALPAANAYFRPAPAGWDPSLPYPGQPPYGAQPPYPGQPAPYGYPAQPPYPGQQPYPPQQPTGEPTTPPPSGPPPQGPPPQGPPLQDQHPHTGSVPPTDPWTPPPSGDQPKRPPTEPTPPA